MQAQMNSRITLRSWSANLYGAALLTATTVLALCAAGFSTGTVGERVGAAVIGVASLVALVRVLSMRVVVDSHGLTLHGLFRSKHIEWHRVVSVSCEVVAVKLFMPVVAPVLHLYKANETPDSVALSALAVYNLSRADDTTTSAHRATTRLEEFRRSFSDDGATRS